MSNQTPRGRRKEEGRPTACSGREGTLSDAGEGPAIHTDHRAGDGAFLMTRGSLVAKKTAGE